jgi:hypothetical protein
MERLHDIWEMNFHTDHINAIMIAFFHNEIKCSSCKRSGLTNAVLYDVPRYLVLSRKSDDVQCVNLINAVDLLVIQPSLEDSKFEYRAHTALMVLENDEVFYLRKITNGFSYYNKVNGQFETLTDITAQYTGLASHWAIFIYETEADVFIIPPLKRTSIDQNSLQPANEPEVWSIDTVQGLLPSFKKPFDVANVTMRQSDIELLLNKDGDLNDLIIDGYLSIIASKAPSHSRVLAVQTHIISQIIDKRLNRFDKKWLSFDIIFCPINQNHHWYIIILDLKKKLIVEFDSMPNHILPRRQNMNRLLKTLDIQHYFHAKTNIDFINDWKYAIPTEDSNFQQQDIHSCGVHLLVYAHAYIQQQKLPNITIENVRLHRFQLAELILRQALPTNFDSDTSVSDILSSSTVAYLLSFQQDGLIEPTTQTLRRMMRSK